MLYGDFRTASEILGPWSQPRLQKIMVPKVDQMLKPPAAHTMARQVLSGVQRSAVTGPGHPG